MESVRPINTTDKPDIDQASFRNYQRGQFPKGHLAPANIITEKCRVDDEKSLLTIYVKPSVNVLFSYPPHL
jgi:hypothetical protein